MKKKEEDIYDKIAKLMMENNQMVTNKDISNSLILFVQELLILC